jgi:hypothetical protein
VIRVCAWCNRFQGLRPPYGRPEITHGLCATCEAMVRGGRAATADAARAHYVVVIDRDRPDLLSKLTRWVAPWTDQVTVVADRRVCERRAVPRPDTQDRRSRGARVSPLAVVERPVAMEGVAAR